MTLVSVYEGVSYLDDNVIERFETVEVPAVGDIISIVASGVAKRYRVKLRDFEIGSDDEGRPSLEVKLLTRAQADRKWQAFSKSSKKKGSKSKG